MGRRRRRRKRAFRPLRAVVLGLLLGGVGLGAGILLHSGVEDGSPSAGGEEAPRSLEREAAPALPSPGNRIRVEVLNAGGVPGMAATARDLLREAGFDVVYFGNAEAFDRERTLVLDRTGRPEMARSVARALGEEGVEHAPDSALVVDVTVLLGSGWSPSVPEAGAETDHAGEREWWDPRGWLEGIRARVGGDTDDP